MYRWWLSTRSGIGGLLDSSS